MERLALRVDELQNELSLLKEQIAKMSAGSAAVSTPVVEHAAEVPKPADPPAEVQIVNDQENSHKLGPFQMKGFSDLGFGGPQFENMSNGILHGAPNSFTVGDFDLFTTAKISDHLSFLAELLITSDFSNSFSAELDRMMLTYKANDYFKVSLGKFNTAIGYYSNGFQPQLDAP